MERLLSIVTEGDTEHSFHDGKLPEETKTEGWHLEDREENPFANSKHTYSTIKTKNSGFDLILHVLYVHFKETTQHHQFSVLVFCQRAEQIERNEKDSRNYNINRSSLGHESTID